MVFTRHAPGKIWSSICMEDSARIVVYFNFDFRIICLKKWSTFYTKAQRKVNVYAKVKNEYCKKGVVSFKSLRKLIWLKIWNSCSDMFRKITVLTFPGKHAWWRPLFSSCTARRLERYLRENPSNIFSCEFSK